MILGFLKTIDISSCNHDITKYHDTTKYHDITNYKGYEVMYFSLHVHVSHPRVGQYQIT